MNRRTKFGLVILALAWYFNDPIPRGFSKPWNLRFNNAFSKLLRQAFWVADYLGLYPMEQALRRLVDANVLDGSEYPEEIRVEQSQFAGIGVRLFMPRAEPRDATGRPALVYYHGGGWTIGSARGSDRQMLEICKQLGDVAIISVEYRMSPEFKFPEPLDDCLAVTKYVLKNAKSLNIDPSRVAVGGDSSGGNLAAAVSLRLRDDDFSPQPRAQVLIYPALQAMDFSLPSYVQNKHGPFLTDRFMAWFWSNYATGSKDYDSTFLRNDHTSPDAKSHIYNRYLRHEDLLMDYHYKPYKKPSLEHGSPETWAQLKEVLQNPYFAPLLADDLAKLPRAFVYTAQYDVLRDDGLLYVDKLRKAGVEVTHVHGTKAFHAVFTFSHVYKEGAECLQSVIDFLKDSICRT